MDRFSLLTIGIIAYVSVAIFLSGTIYRVVMWQQRSKRISANNVPTKTRENITLIQWLGDSRMGQLLIIALLATALGLFLGHTRIFGDMSFVISIFGEDRLNHVGNILGTSLGLFLLAIVGYLLIRRLASGQKELSARSGYLPLLLILFLVLLGNYLRLVKPFGLEDYHAFAASLVVLDSAFPDAIAASPARWALISHVFMASLLFIYVPFSGFIPAVCDHISKWLKCAGSNDKMP